MLPCPDMKRADIVVVAIIIHHHPSIIVTTPLAQS
jgi:hypothetical protein